jgi:hypothetical protein
MTGGWTRRRFAVVVTVAGIITLSMGACGDDDTAASSETTIAATTQAPAGSDTAPAAQETTAGGEATVTIPEGTFLLTLEEPCVLEEVGIGAIASSGEATLMIAGPPEVAVVVVELSSGAAWSAAAAEVTIDGGTIGYTGPAMGPNGSGEISVIVDCG